MAGDLRQQIGKALTDSSDDRTWAPGPIPRPQGHTAPNANPDELANSQALSYGPGPRAAGAARLPQRIGRYQIASELGRGGMGVVYAAYDPALERQVAVKILLGVQDLEPGDRQRFLREARAAGRLDHPGIVRIFDVGSERRCDFIVMDLVDGRTLREAFKLGLPREDGLRVVGDVAEAVAFAHERGIVHRDIKPENVILRADTGRAQLMDFGVAVDATVRRQTQTGIMLGTPRYMAPEQVMGEAGPMVDVYALGAILYELCCGRTPFLAPSLPILLARLAKDPPEPPSRHAPDIDPELERLILSCLEKDAEARPGAWEVAEWLRGERAPAEQPPRRRGLSLAAALAVLGLLGIIGGALALRSRATPADVAPADVAPADVAPADVAPADVAEPPPLAAHPADPPLVDALPVDPPAAPATETEVGVLLWRAAHPEAKGVEITARSGISPRQGGRHWAFTQPGASRLTAAFVLERYHVWVRLELGHLASLSNGVRGAPVQIRLNGQLVAVSYDPPGNLVTPFDVTRFVRTGENELEISYQQNAITHYWLRMIKISYGDREPPTQQKKKEKKKKN